MGTAIILDGKTLAGEIHGEQQQRVESLSKKTGRPPGLAVILVGNDPASHAYVSNKRKACHRVGIYAPDINLPSDTPLDAVLESIDQFNNDPAIDGILVQLPLPAHIPKEQVLLRISPDKDVDGFHPVNLGRLVAGEPGLVACTPRGIITLMDRFNLPIAGKHAVVIGRSLIVGKPMALLLLNRNATVTVCHSHTADLPHMARQADILVAALGKPEMIGRDFVKPGAVVIDVGISRGSDGKLKGDVLFDEVREIAGAITPVPGGIGPMTIATLLDNTIDAFRAHTRLT
ncbi:MAG: bifunctional methylenetetrahydrofolate dehydrogenase/methenyltetrahydrofolate cyclohydrolase FolD [Nitrospirota bacterium]|nr:bifunctional methylenetetrahydrofolate dehydrogenase/methenyltetrahydrofolate cyclohydrolase FolD [Nitrospirota bacterium]